MKRRTLPLAILACLLVLSLLGCGSKGQTVTGVVLLDGKALADAELEFVPFDRAKVGGGDIVRTDAEGKFTVAPSSRKAGLHRGKYIIYVSKWVDPKTEQAPPPEEMEMLKASNTLKNIVPSKYNNKEDLSPLIVEVPVSGPVKLEMKNE
jgi:hypothetical protein